MFNCCTLQIVYGICTRGAKRDPSSYRENAEVFKVHSRFKKYSTFFSQRRGCYTKIQHTVGMLPSHPLNFFGSLEWVNYKKAQGALTVVQKPTGKNLSKQVRFVHA